MGFGGQGALLVASCLAAPGVRAGMAGGGGAAVHPSGGCHPACSAVLCRMYLVALGAGGIKPCVVSFGADQVCIVVIVVKWVHVEWMHRLGARGMGGDGL